MSTDIQKYIEDHIITPLNQALNGEEFDWNILDFIKIVKRNGFHNELYEAMLPLCEEYVIHPENRMVNYHLWATLNQCDEKKWQHRATDVIIDWLRDNSIVPIIQKYDLALLLEGSLYFERNKYHEPGFFRTIVFDVVLNNYTTDWNDLYGRVKPELIKGPKDYDRTRVEYFCLLMSVIMIFKSEGLSDEERKAHLITLRNKWCIVADLYSIMTGLIIYSNYKNPIQVVNQFSDSKKEYAHLMLSAVRVRPAVLIAKNSWKQTNYDAARNKLERAKDEECANHELDALFHIIFPKATLDEYAHTTNRLTAAETQKRFEEQQALILEQTKLINDQKIEISELRLYREAAEKLTNGNNGDTISIEELKVAINSIEDPDKAQQFYFQLDFVLTENAVWIAHRFEFYQLVKDKLKMPNKKNATVNFNAPVGQAIGNVDTIINKEDTK